MRAMAVDAGYPGLGSWKSYQVAMGVSADANVLSGMMESLLSSLAQSATAQKRINEPLDALFSVYKECTARNWDGEQAPPVTIKSFNEARDLLMLIPSSFPVPSFSPESSGAIAFEWYKNAKNVFVISVDGTQSIQYAGLFGDGNETHGKVNYAGSIPRVIQTLLDDFLRR